MKGAQLMNVPVHQHGPLVVVCNYGIRLPLLQSCRSPPISPGDPGTMCVSLSTHCINYRTTARRLSSGAPEVRH
jgi:hypothetical protein